MDNWTLARSQIVPGRVRSHKRNEVSLCHAKSGILLWSIALGRAKPSAVRGQSSTTFAVLVIALSFVMMLGAFAASNVMKTKATRTINTLFVEAITDKVLLTLVEMKIIINTTDTYNFTRVIAVPEVIGNKPFIVAGRGSLLEVRTLDNTAVFRETNTSRVWEGLNITGAAGSSGGKITLNYIRGRREIRIS